MSALLVLKKTVFTYCHHPPLQPITAAGPDLSDHTLSLSLSQFFNSTISVTMETQFLGTMSWLPSASLLACHLKKEHVHVVPVAVSVTWLINGCRFCSVYSYGFYIGPAQLLQQVTAGRVYCAERMRCDETLALSAIVGRICSWKCWWI